MSAVVKGKMTEEEYLAKERVNEFKSEFFNGEMFAMAGASWNHNRIKSNLEGELYAKLKGGKCQAVSSDQRIKIESTGLYTYPDIAIVCGEPQFSKLDKDALVNPQVVIEVLSPTTENYDRSKKFRHYERLAPLKEYILVSQEEIRIERSVRQPNGSWLLTTFSEPTSEFQLDSLPVSIKLADIYAGVTFPEATEGFRIVIQDRTPPGP